MALCHSQVTLMLCTDINITETTYSCQFQYVFGNHKWVIAVKVSKFSGQYLCNHWTLDIGVLSYIIIVWPKEHSPEVRSFPPGTPCIYMCVCLYIYMYVCVYVVYTQLTSTFYPYLGSDLASRRPIATCKDCGPLSWSLNRARK